ncbi:hypothetical protein NDI44_27835 [Trichocoleus sp. DQ-A3]|uniref:hypothetical protein n=2 Tax=Cyanobacteriota TaxID=1117 RepID=UPI00168352C2|nr:MULTISPECIES: hypothetical protein [unclassified Coleofasciculus]MBD1900112.1 hypothetical protein [Coleofasciculus sp. FACHB-125]
MSSRWQMLDLLNIFGQVNIIRILWPCHHKATFLLLMSWKQQIVQARLSVALCKFPYRQDAKIEETVPDIAILNDL